MFYVEDTKLEELIKSYSDIKECGFSTFGELLNQQNKDACSCLYSENKHDEYYDENGEK